MNSVNAEFCDSFRGGMTKPSQIQSFDNPSQKFIVCQHEPQQPLLGRRDRNGICCGNCFVFGWLWGFALIASEFIEFGSDCFRRDTEPKGGFLRVSVD